MSGFFNSLKRAASASPSTYLSQGKLEPESLFIPTVPPTNSSLIPEPTEMQFSIQPAPGDSGFSQWHSAMLMVAQLPGGIPPEFRRTLWLNLADRHLSSRKVQWNKVERECFSEWSHPADSELGVQIVKDLHRTGCSLFCGEDGQENQALLKRVLLAYARWNKAVGYCQGFNMLAALILQVTEKCESEALKLMIFLIEGVLPESYFADSLRGLSVDMAVFRELLKSQLPKLSRHLDTLQTAAKDGNTSYEPPLTNVFTMQWFLTLFCNCLPQPTVLRVWDLILLEGNEILLRTALSIWQALADRILTVRSADEFYCIMGVLTREILEFGIVDANLLVKSIVTIGTLTELPHLREKYLYNINPWGNNISSSVVSEVRNRQLKVSGREKLVLDISALKKQYSKLKQRQRQAHIIFSAAVSKQVPVNSQALAINHLLLGKNSFASPKRLGPPKGAIPPVRNPQTPSTLLWKDAPPRQSSSSSSSDTELCDNSDENEEVSTNNQLQEDNRDKENPVETENICNVKPEMPTEITVSEDFLDFDSTIDFDTGQTCNVNNEDNNAISDIFDTNSITQTTTKLFDFGKYPVNSDSDDECFDFDKFLESRVCLKQTSVDDESITSGSEDSSEHRKAVSSRKSCQRALEIIQENSLILHRILQCQNRITPSPSIQNFENPIDCPNLLRDNEPIDGASSDNITVQDAVIPYNKQFSHNLPWNEECKGSESRSSGTCTVSDTSSACDIGRLITEDVAGEDHDSRHEYNDVDDNVLRPSFVSILDSEYSKNLEARYENLIIKSARPTYLDVASRLDIYKGSHAETSSKLDGTSPKSKSPKSEHNIKISPGDCSNFVRSPTSNRIYNPFPVNISSRQNKELALRLGLYKKL